MWTTYLNFKKNHGLMWRCISVCWAPSACLVGLCLPADPSFGATSALDSEPATSASGPRLPAFEGIDGNTSRLLRAR